MKKTLKESKSKKVLILCHDKKVSYKDGKMLGHWQDEFQGNLLSTFGIENADVWTVDIKKSKSDRHYVADVWSKEFGKQHQGEFDFIFMPDCGGEWYYASEEKDPVKQFERITTLINTTLEHLKPNGILVVGKIFKNPRNILKLVYDQDGYFLKSKQLGTEHMLIQNFQRI